MESLNVDHAVGSSPREVIGGSSKLTRLHVRNYRALADISCRLQPLNVIFGANGAGKSSFLDTIWFVRDCAINGVEHASSSRSHGVGMLWDGAEQGESLSITLENQAVTFELRFGFSAGRIEPFLGERLTRKSDGVVLIDRTVGSDKARFHNAGLNEDVQVTLREPQKLSLNRYLDFDERVPEAQELDSVLRYVSFHSCRAFDLYRLKTHGSEADHQTRISWRGQNLWSVLRNLKDRRGRDSRYDTIHELMRRAFPGSFDDLHIEQTGPTSVYARISEHGLREPIHASGISDGYLHMLLLLTILFSEGPDRGSLIILDEPEISLHPWALVVLAEALRLAASEWNNQIIVATHAPALIGQFQPDELLVAETLDNSTQLRRLSTVENVSDLLEDYSAGALYMAGAVAPQERCSEPS
jgi:predicted ATPase